MNKIVKAPALPSLFILAAFFAGCNQNSSSPSSGPSYTPPAAQQAVPPPAQQPQSLSLYIVPFDQGKFSMEQIQADKKKIEQDPNDVRALISLADANFMIQRFEKSQDYYERALKSDPKNINARLSLSNCYIFMQKPDEALHQLDEILSMQKDNPEALYNKGLILLQSKRDPGGAKQVWTQLVSAHADHELAKQVKGELGRL
ncbi:MAG TPA: tetratricopeptide repeat protein [Nitrospiria bacterium]|jgi:tetratricopeptide (TPR) repeat protein|nr:tetratricopeptide repeat protein [Nitrospiria bacterium]